MKKTRALNVSAYAENHPYEGKIMRLQNEINKIGMDVNQIEKNNNSHLHRKSDKISFIKYMEEIHGLIKKLILTVMTE